MMDNQAELSYSPEPSLDEAVDLHLSPPSSVASSSTRDSPRSLTPPIDVVTTIATTQVAGLGDSLPPPLPTTTRSSSYRSLVDRLVAATDTPIPPREPSPTYIAVTPTTSAVYTQGQPLRIPLRKRRLQNAPAAIAATAATAATTTTVTATLPPFPRSAPLSLPVPATPSRHSYLLPSVSRPFRPQPPPPPPPTTSTAATSLFPFVDPPSFEATASPFCHSRRVNHLPFHLSLPNNIVGIPIEIRLCR